MQQRLPRQSTTTADSSIKRPSALREYSHARRPFQHRLGNQQALHWLRHHPQGLTPGIPFVKPTYRPLGMQAKMPISQPGDSHELEADRMADRVMRMPDTAVERPLVSSAPKSLQRMCAACEEERGDTLSRKADPSSSEPPQTAPSSHRTNDHASGFSGGQPLPAQEQAFFEPRFGRDLSGVRVHSGSTAHESAVAVNALAYTIGNDIVFAKGQFSPETTEGRRLIAHELAHVLQQRDTPGAVVHRMAPCPGHLEDGDPTPPGWKSYFGSTSVFHCGYRGILEDRSPASGDPQNECFYDHDGRLVTEYHPFSGCRGTPNEYDASSGFWNALGHTFLDSGGITWSGLPAFGESRLHDLSNLVSPGINWLERGIRGLYGVP